MSDPKRREQRRTHLDASVVPVERALLARAEVIGSERGHALTELLRQNIRVCGGKAGDAGWADIVGPAIAATLAAEVRSLADELHWW